MQEHNDLAHADNSETDTTPLQPMGFTDIVGGIFRLYRNHFRLFFGIAIVYLIAMLVLSILNIVPTAGSVISIFTTLGNSLVSFLFAATLFYASAQAYLGRNITVQAAFKQTWRRFGAYLGSTLLVFLVQGGALAIIGMVGVSLFATNISLDNLVTGGFLSFVLSFLIASVFIMILWMPFAIYFGVRWGFYPLAVLFEETTATNALRLSTELVKGTWWRVFGIAIGIGLIAIIILLIPYIVITFSLTLAGIVKTGDSSLLSEVGGFSHLIQDFVTATITALATPIGIIGATLLYFDLRTRKIDIIEATLQSFDLRNRQIRHRGNTLAFVAIIFGILVLINFLSTRRFIRGDLTEDKRYTISKSTKNVIGSLDDIVTITAYFSTAPAEVARIRREVKDVLDEYNAFSQKLQIDFVSPADFEDAQKQELRFKGIPEVQINVVKKDKAEIANVYMGISIGYSGKEETLPVVRSTGNLEYELTSTILKVTTKEAKTVGFLTGHGEFDINAQEYQQFRQLLDKNGQGQYNITSVNLQDGKAVDATVTTLVVAGVKQPLTEREKYELDQFIMRGGRAIFLIDSIQMQPGTLQGTPLSTGLNDLLEHYGAKLGNNLIIDRRFHDSARFQQGFMTVFQPYPYFVKIIKSNFSKEHTVTNQLEALTLPWTSSLEIIAKENVTATALAKTSEFGQTIQGYYNLRPDFPIPDADTQAFPVAVALEGKFKSFYDGKEMPSVATDDPTSAEGSETPTPAQDAETRTTKTESEQTQIVVVGTAQFLAQMRQDGINFFLNTVDWLTLGDALIGIRSQMITDRPLRIKTHNGEFREVSEFEKNFIRYLCIGGVSLLVIAFGLVRYFLKRRTKQLVESMAR